MNNPKNLGIWLDHASAHAMECTTNPVDIKVIDTGITHQNESHDAGNGEHQANNKAQHNQAGFYKKLGEVIRKYDAVLLFGPTNAKAELHNLLKNDHLFANIKIDVKQADKMTEHQQHAFVKEHFYAASGKSD